MLGADVDEGDDGGCCFILRPESPFSDPDLLWPETGDSAEDDAGDSF